MKNYSDKKFFSAEIIMSLIGNMKKTTALLPNLMLLTLIFIGNNAFSAHPKFYANGSTEVTALINKSQDTSTNNIFGISPKSLADDIISEADSYLNERSFTSGDYTILFPYLKPFPHPNSRTGGTPYSLHVGTSTTTSSWVRWDLTTPVTGDYTIEFEYYYDDADDQENYKVFTSFNGTSYTVAYLTQTDNKLYVYDKTEEVATLQEKTWYHIAIDVDNTNSNYDLYINGSLVHEDGSLMGASGTLSAIGSLGDLTYQAGYSGQGWWDNFRVTKGADTQIYDYFSTATLGTHWTTLGTVVQDTSVVPHTAATAEGYPSPYWTAISTAIQKRLKVSAMAYLLTSQSKYSDYCKEVLLSVCGNGWDTWTDVDYPVTPALSEPFMCDGVAYAYDTIYSQMNSSELTTVQDAMINYAMAPFYDRLDEVNLLYNIDMVQVAALGNAALVMVDDVSGMSTYLDAARSTAADFFGAADIDGGWIEGTGYGALTIESIITFCYNDERLTTYNALGYSYLDEVSNFCYQLMSPSMSDYTKFCDSTGNPVAYQYIHAVLHSQLSDPLAITILSNQGWYEKTPMGFVLFPSDVSTGDLPDISGISTGWNFRDIGWNTARSSWESDALMFATHAGPKSSHSQLDENNLVVSKGNVWFACDPGYHVSDGGSQFSYTYGTSGHNCLMVGNNDQSFYGGTIKGFYSGDRFAYSAGDAVTAYPNLLTTAFRKIILDKNHEFMLVFDKYKKATGVTDPVHFLLHSECSDLSIASQLITVEKENYQMDLQVLSPSAATISYKPDLYCKEAGYSYLFLNIPSGEENDTWQLTVTTYSGLGGLLKQYMSIGGYTNLGSIPGGETWQETTFTLTKPYYDYSSSENGTNVLLGFVRPTPVLVEKITAKNVTKDYTYSVYAGNADDTDMTKLVCFDPGTLYLWSEADTYHSRTARSNIGAVGFDIQDSTNPSEGIFMNAICTSNADAPTYFKCYDDHNVIVTGADNSVSVIKVNENLTHMAMEYLDADDICQAGDIGDNSITSHNPGICFLNAEWDSPAANGMFTARTAQYGDANFYLNVATNETAPYRIAVVYKSSQNGIVGQYMSSARGYETVGEFEDTNGDYNTMFIYARPPFHDYSGYTGTNILFYFSKSITVARMYAEKCEETDFCDVGTTDDSTVSSHSPGICLYPSTEWESSATKVSNYTGREALGSGGNLYVNIDDTQKLYYVELTYTASSDRYLKQRIGASDFKDLITLPGDGTVRKVIVPIDRNYYDYNGTGSDNNINIMLRIYGGAFTLIDAAVTGDGIKQ